MSNQSTSERIKEIAELEEQVIAMKNQLVLEKLIEHSKPIEASKEKPKEFEFELKIETESIEECNTIHCFESDALFKNYNFVTKTKKNYLISLHDIMRLWAKEFHHVNEKKTIEILDFCEQITHYENVMFDCNSDVNFKVYPNRLIIGDKMYDLIKNIESLKESYHEYLQEPNLITFDLVKK